MKKVFSILMVCVVMTLVFNVVSFNNVCAAENAGTIKFSNNVMRPGGFDVKFLDASGKTITTQNARGMGFRASQEVSIPQNTKKIEFTVFYGTYNFISLEYKYLKSDFCVFERVKGAASSDNVISIDKQLVLLGDNELEVKCPGTWKLTKHTK